MTLIDNIINLRHEGKSDNNIKQELQQKGNSIEEIEKAFNELDNVSTPSPQQPQQPTQYNKMRESTPQSESPSQSTSNNIRSVDFNELNDIVEAVINEKWEELLKEVGKIVKWKTKVETEMTKMEDNVSHLKENFENLHSAVVGKINESDENMKSVSSTLKAIERVFKEVMTEFTSSVRELGRITNFLRERKEDIPMGPSDKKEDIKEEAKKTIEDNF